VFGSWDENVLGIEHHKHAVGTLPRHPFHDEAHPELYPRERGPAQPLCHHSIGSIDDRRFYRIAPVPRIDPDVLDHPGHASALPGLYIPEGGHVVDRPDPASEVLSADVLRGATKLFDDVADRHDRQVWQYRSAAREI
jgi:hypothetical protein